MLTYIHRIWLDICLGICYLSYMVGHIFLNVCILYGRIVVIHLLIMHNILAYTVWLDMFCIPVLSGCSCVWIQGRYKSGKAEMSYEMLMLLMHLKWLTYLQRKIILIMSLIIHMLVLSVTLIT